MHNPASPSPSSQNSSRFPVGPWRRAARGAGLVEGPEQRPTPTIFETMTGLATTHEAVNLGQGFPDTDGPEWVREIAARAIVDGSANQYAPGSGRLDLREAVAAHRERHYGLSADPASEVLITSGATEGLAATVLALVSPGDRVITFSPFYDEYGALAGLTGAQQIVIPMQAPEFVPDPLRLAEVLASGAQQKRRQIVILNTPHNPSGVALGAEQITQLVTVCARYGAWLVTDEVYEHLMLDPGQRTHTPVAAHARGYGRLVTVSSAGKMLSLTGWKVGWVIAPAPVIQAIRAVKQFLTYSTGPAFQVAVAEALNQPERLDDFLTAQQDQFREQRDRLVAALRGLGLNPVVPDAGYFTVVDLAPVGVTDARATARDWVQDPGVAGIPMASFCALGSRHAEQLSSWMRLAFCKSPAVMDEGITRLERLGSGGQK